MEEKAIEPKDTIKTKHVLDFTGGKKKVSLCILSELNDRLDEVEAGESIELIIDAFEGLRSDILSWGRLSGHKVEEKSFNGFHQYIVITKSNIEKKGARKLCVVISNDGLLDLVSPLGFALAAASAGVDVSLYFQGPGVRVLKKGFKGKLPGLQAPFSVFARKGMARMGHDLPQEKVIKLEKMGAKVFICHPSLDVFRLKVEDIALDNYELAEYCRFMEEILDSASLIYA